MGDKYSKNVLRLGFVSFFTDMSTEMILGILPLFIIGQLGASRALLGLIEGVGEFVSYVSRTISGPLSDKLGRRKIFIVLGYSISTLSKPLFAVSSVWTHALFVRGTDRFGKGVRTAPRDALLSDSVDSSRVGRAFGTHRTLDQSGAVIGPLLAFALIPLMGIRGIFWVSFIPGAIAVLILIFLVKERKMSKREGTSLLSNFSTVFRGRLMILLIILSIFSIGAFNFSFILLQGMELELAPAFIPLVFLVINLAHAAVGYPSGILSDKIGAERTLILAYSVFFVTSFMGLISPDQPYWAFAMAAVFGVYIGMTDTVQRAVIPKYVPNELRGTAYGIFYLMIGISFLLANAIFGTLWDILGSSTAFTYSLSTTAIALVALTLFTRLPEKKVVSLK
ncbi:MAG: MFS transporter [Nitrososphaerales archaeon]